MGRQQSLPSWSGRRIVTETGRVIGVNLHPPKHRIGKAEILGGHAEDRRQLEEARLELRSERKEAATTHLQMIGNSMCKDPVVGRQSMCVGLGRSV